MRIIVVASRKGGSGKTTLAGHLGVQAEREGIAKVALADMDPQGSLTDWWNLRPSPSPHFLQTTAQGLAEDVAELRRLGFGLLIIDTPPALTRATELRTTSAPSARRSAWSRIWESRSSSFSMGRHRGPGSRATPSPSSPGTDRSPPSSFIPASISPAA